jgi:DnaK suppressor protein
MSDNFDSIRAILIAERDQICASLAGLAADDRSLAADAADPANRREQQNEGNSMDVERASLARLAASQTSQLAEVDAAIERLSAGRYGVCTGCHQPIPVARLEIRPMAERCVGCASR